jgi:hypothetical protein
MHVTLVTVSLQVLYCNFTNFQWLYIYNAQETGQMAHAGQNLLLRAGFERPETAAAMNFFAHAASPAKYLTSQAQSAVNHETVQLVRRTGGSLRHHGCFHHSLGGEIDGHNPITIDHSVVAHYVTGVSSENAAQWLTPSKSFWI